MSTAGERLSAALSDRYRIERELGQGGMATVFLAEDLKHDRKVAIKVLKPDLAAVLGAERFVQEIKTTAALSHPHILPLFDSGEAGGFLYYVMPYIEGETVREKLNREAQFGIEEAIRIATEVADALDYAHRHGVIHRDIKPENILLHDGRPMVMDFGIALAVSAAAGGRMTETGLSLGTPHYMSPEQATADKDLTARSDIYSLASVLYEMLAGQPPHVGGSAQQVIMRIIADVPRPVSELRKTVPPHVAATLARALEKLPADRFGSARELADGLLGRGLPSTMLPTPGALPASSRQVRILRHPLVLGLATALVGALAVVATQWASAGEAGPGSMVRFHIEVPRTMLLGNVGSGTSLAVSPDGTMIAYISEREAGVGSVFLRRLDQSEAQIIDGTEGGLQPAFSPDGQWIAYVIRDMIWKVPIAGGRPIPVGSTLAAPSGLTWSPAGLILVGSLRGIVALPAGGGTARVVAALDSAAGDLYFNQPRALPDGETVLLAIQPTGGLSRTRFGTVSLKTGKLTRYDLSLLDPLAILDGALIYVLPTGALMAVGIDLRAGRLTGDPMSLGPTVLTDITGASDAALSPTGTLVYLQPEVERVLGWVAADGGFTPVLGEPRAYAYPRLSPSGRQVALSIAQGERSDVWIYDLALGTPTRMTSEGSLNERPEWSPDGRRILYRADRGTRTGIWWQPVDQSAPAEPLQASDAHDFYEGVIAPDGKTLVFQIDDAVANQADVMSRALEGDTTARIISSTPFQEAQPRLSPDGRWVAYVTDASGASQVVVQPYPGPGGRVQVSSATGSEPVWSRDGKRLFYRDGRHLMAASVTTSPQFAVTSRTELFADEYFPAEAPHANYDVSPDGRRFLMVKGTGVPRLHVTYGWLRELRERLRTLQR